jgi:AcrR family transcriptional regulator
MHFKVQEGFRLKNRMGSNEAVAKARGGGSREAIIEAAERLFLERGFGSVTMDELAEAAGVARRTLYNQFASKEEIFREMLLRVSGQLETAFPPGIETRGEVEDVLRLIARMILGLHKNRNTSGFSAWWWPTPASFPGSPRSSPPSWSLRPSGSCAISRI